MLPRIFAFVFAVWCVSLTEGARILAVAPLPSYSHQVAFRPIWKELSLRGHDVTLITTDGINDPALTNLTEIVIHDETYKIWRESGVIELMKDKSNQLNPFAAARIYLDLFANLTRAVMEQKEVKRLLENDTTFDLVMTEPLLVVGLGFADRYKCKSIYVMSLEAPSYLHEAMGNPTHPILYLEVALPVIVKTYMDRLLVTALFLFHYVFRSPFFTLNTNLLREYFGEDTSPVGEIMNKANMLFVNVNPAFAGVRPVTPSTIYYGAGSHLEPEKPLPTDLKEFLDAADKGAVYFSLGTNVLSKDLSEEKRNVLLDTFRELPFRFLWKFEDNSLQNLPKNVKIAKWIPQQDVLRHPNVKAFITQCGLQSTEEAIFSKVPIIGMPQIADQLTNIERVVELGLGVQVDFNNLNKENLKRTILDVITNTTYRENMEQFVKLSTDRPMSGVEETIWWTEYVLRHNNTEHLKGPARNVSTFQFLLLDVIGGLLLVAFIIIYLFIKLFKIVCRLLLRKILGKTHKD